MVARRRQTAPERVAFLQRDRTRQAIADLVVLVGATALGAGLLAVPFGWVGALVAVAGLLVELGFRLATHPPFTEEPGYFRPSEDPGQVYELRPRCHFRYFYHGRGFSGVERTIDHRTNEHGLRGRDYTVPKPRSTFRILGMGDSVCFGQGVALEDTYLEQMELRLSGLAEGHVEVLNGGVMGYNTVQEEILFRRLGPLYEPDLVVLSYSLDDALRVFGANLEHHGVETRWRPPLKRRLQLALTRHLATYRWYGRRRFLTTLPDRMRQLYDDDSPGWLAAQRALKAIDAGADALGARTLVVVKPVFALLGDDYPLRSVHATIVECCTRRGLDVVDLLPAFEGARAAVTTVHPTDIHPGPEAHRRMADAILTELGRRDWLPGPGTSAATPSRVATVGASSVGGRPLLRHPFDVRRLDGC